MTQESISRKLTELFELYNSGAINKDEYEKLKGQLYDDMGVGEIEREENQKEEITIIPEKPVEEIIEEPKSSTLPEKPPKEVKEEPKSSTLPEKSVKGKKRGKIWLLPVIVGVCVIAFVIFKLIQPSTFESVTEAPEHVVKDIDGNVYHTVEIGSQVWMVENLQTTKYNDGTPIPLATENSEWRKLTTPAYCWYNNDETTNKDPNGALYNWYAVNTNKLCPEGWHVPSDSEWITLIEYLSTNGHGYLGSGDDIGKSLASTKGWNVSSDLGSVGNDPSSNNKSGFTAFASGIRFSNGEFRHSGQNSKWWTSTETSPTAAQIRFIAWEDGNVTSYSNRKENGFSVRCVKDKVTR